MGASILKIEHEKLCHLTLLGGGAEPRKHYLRKLPNGDLKNKKEAVNVVCVCVCVVCDGIPLA